MNLGTRSFCADHPNRCVKKVLDPSYSGSIYSYIISSILIEFTIWDKLVFEKNTSINRIIQDFAEKYGRKIIKLYYENIIFYEVKKNKE